MKKFSVVIRSVGEFWEVIKGQRLVVGQRLEALHHRRKDKSPTRMTVYRALKVANDVGFRCNWSSAADFRAALCQRARELGQGRIRLAKISGLTEATMKKILSGRHCPSFEPALALVAAMDALDPALEPLALRIELAPAGEDVAGSPRRDAGDKSEADRRSDDEVEGAGVEGVGVEGVGVSEVVPDVVGTQVDTPASAIQKTRPALDAAKRRRAPSQRRVCPHCRRRRASSEQGQARDVDRTEGDNPPHRGTEDEGSAGPNSRVAAGPKPKSRGGRTQDRGGQTQGRINRSSPLVGRRRVAQPGQAMHVVMCRFPDGRVIRCEESSLGGIHQFLLRAIPADDLMDAEIYVDDRPYDPSSLVLRQEVNVLKSRMEEAQRPPSSAVNFWDICQAVAEQYHEYKREQRRHEKRKEKRHGRK